MAISTPLVLIRTIAVGILGALANVAMAQDASPVVMLTSPAFESPPLAGELLRFQASVSGGRAPYTFEWDLDGDGEVDRRSAAAQIEASFPSRKSVEVGVQVIDADGRRGVVSRALRVRGPEILVERIGSPMIGLNDPRTDPGDFVSQPLRFTNVGDALHPAGLAIFAASNIQPTAPTSASGYTAITQDAGLCGYDWIDLVNGPFATPAQVTTVANGNSRGPLNDARGAVIELGGGWFRLHGERYPRAVMSTNGYLSFNVADSGGDFTPSCDAYFSEGASGPQLRPLHDDLMVAGDGNTSEFGAGLRYRYFTSCPRLSRVGQRYACHVFSWTSMQRWNQGNPSERFDFQAIAYEGSHEIAYQYRNPPPDGVATTIGIVNADGSEAFNATCGAASEATADRAVCFLLTNSLTAVTPPVEEMPIYVDIRELAAGQSFQSGIAFKLSRTAACNQPFAVDYIGTASDRSQSFRRTRAAEGRIAELCQPTAPVSNPFSFPPEAPIPRRSGLYLTPSRPGNGLVNFARRVSPPAYLAVQRDAFAGAWYTAVGDRTPVWYILEGDLINGAGELSVRRFGNAGAPDGFATTSEIAGKAWISQINADRAMFAWELDDGSTGIEYMHSSGLPSGAPNRTQTWFSPRESGWGLAIESLYIGTPFEFIVAFIYDAEGKPRWVVGDSNTNTGGSIQLTGHRPHCPGCPWIADWSSDGQPAGRLQLGYQGQISGTLGTTIQLPPPYRGNWMREALPIQPIAQPVQ